MGKGSSKAKGGISGGLQGIEISNKILKDHTEQVKILKTLTNQYNSRLGKVETGAEKAAGDVDMSGYTMKLSSAKPETAVHEFAHTLANSQADKYGLTNDKEFWKEIKKVRREYHADVDKKQDTSRWITAYEHSSKSVDEFFADAFAHAKLKEMGYEKPRAYGNDYTYSNQVLKITNKYFGKN